MSQPPDSPSGSPDQHDAARPGRYAPWAAAPAGIAPLQRDRIAPYLVWDGLLGVLTVILVIVALATGGGRHLSNILGHAGYVGLATAGFALSLRTATPNLAVGSIAALTGGIGAYLAGQGWSLALAMTLAVGLSAVLGLILGALVAGLSVPSWAATLGAAGMIEMLMVGLAGGNGIVVPGAGSVPPVLWFVLFAVVSIGGGVLWWLVPGLRRSLSGARRGGEPGRWAGLSASLGTLLGLTVSSVLAGLAGVALVGYLHYAQVGVGSSMTTTALAAALFGGVSIFGRRAGVAGTFCAVLIVEICRSLLVVNDAPSWVAGLFIGFVALLGLGVSRLLESVSGMQAEPLGALTGGAGPGGPPPSGPPVPGIPPAGGAPSPGAPPPPPTASPPPTKAPQNPPRPY